MTEKNAICIILSFIMYVFSILVIGLIPIGIINRIFVLFNDSLFNYILSSFFSVLSFTLLIKVKEINKIFIKFLILFLMIYFSLVFGANTVFDFVLKKIIVYYEMNNLINTQEYETLWKVWSNDLSRNFLFFFVFLYSLIVTLFYLIFLGFINKKRTKKAAIRTNNTNG